VLAHLNRRFQNLFARWAVRAGDAALVTTSISWAGTPAVATLPTDQIDIVRIETSAGILITIIPTREVSRSWHLAPACIQVGATLRSRGAIAHARGYERDPANGDVSSMLHKAAPASITTLNDSLDGRFPVRHELGLVLDLALMLAMKQEGLSPATIQSIREELTREEATFAFLIGETTSIRQAANAGKVPASEKGG